MPRTAPAQNRAPGVACCAASICLLLLGLAGCEPEASRVSLLPETTPSGESPWLAAERKRFSDLLSVSTVDVVVVPFQTDGYSFDSAERTLLALRIANFIAVQTGLRVADPQLAGRALGEGWRRFDDVEIRTLAESMGARHVVVGSIGHDRASTFRVTIRTWSSETPGELSKDLIRKEKSWELSFTDEQYPHQVFAEQLRAVTGMLDVNVEQSAGDPAMPAPSSAPDAVPGLETLLDRSSPLSASRLHLLQLAAIAYPGSGDRASERAWVRTLGLAYQQPVDAPGRNLLIARALAHLGRRPAALELLEGAQTPAKRALREWLNGNLPQGETEAAAIEAPVQRLIAHIELGDLRWAYGLTSGDNERELLASFLPEDSLWWPPLLARLGGGTDSWPAPYLGRFFPLPETGWEGVRDRVEWLWEEFESSADWTGFEVATAAMALEYGNQWMVEHAAELSGTGKHGTWLLLDLLAARVGADAFEELGDTRGMPARFAIVRGDIAKAARYFVGHPQLTAMQARIEWKEHDRYLGAEQARWLAAALRDTEDALHWSQRMTGLLIAIDHNVPEIPEVSERLAPYRDAYFWDLPGNIYWLPLQLRDDERARKHYRDMVLAHTVSEFYLFEWLLGQEEDERWLQAVRDAVPGRFRGNPNVAEFHAAALRDGGDLRGAEEIYRAIVGRDSAPYSAYDSLAEVLVEQGRFADAFRIVRSYPGFKADSGEDRIRLSNRAEFAAMLFYRIGQFEYALPLLQLSVDYDTNSNANMTSKAILAKERGDYQSAARIRMKQARTYRNFEALNAYLPLAFALGDYAPARAVFNEVHRDGNGWQLVSQMARSVRAEGWTDARIREWLSGERIRGLVDANGTYHSAAHAAVAAFIVDREPPPDFPELVRELQATSPYFTDEDGNIAMINPHGLSRLEDVVCGPSDYASDTEVSQGPVDSHLVYFAKAYLALESGDHARAQDLLEQAASLFTYPASPCENTSYLMPFLAVAAALNRDTERLERYLERIPFEYRRTNYHLARAAIAGVSGREDEARQALDTALYRWSSDRFRTVPTRYVYADICRRLYEITGAEPYREQLLWWLGVHQRMHPASSWSYALEARYAADPLARQHALAMTLLLDRNSPTIEQASDSELTAARAWLVENNPFRSKPANDGGAEAAVY